MYVTFSDLFQMISAFATSGMFFSGSAYLFKQKKITAQATKLSGYFLR